jgi:Cys-tRNA(Pro) deacylase
MAKIEYPMTQAVRWLQSKQIAFEPHLYHYEEHGGTRVAAESLNVPEHAVIKTLVLEDDRRKPLIVLMHGDCEVSTKQLARLLEVKRVTPCDPTVANKHTGYMVGGISPFGTRAPLLVYAEATIFDLEKLYINGGKRGFLVALTPDDLRAALPLQEVSVAVEA